LGKFSRSKGLRFERQLVNSFQEVGLGAERIPLSGSAGGSFTGDITLPVRGVDKRLEAKKRSTGFKQIYDWLEGNYGLVIGRDRSEPLVVMRLSEFRELAK
jgi:hypothetical protein